MPRQRRMFVLLLATALAGAFLAGAPESVARAELFQVDRIEVEGVRHMPADEVRRIASVSPSATVWSDTGPVVRRVASHPLVRDVRVRRRIPSTLRIEVREREPVALANVPVLTPVDVEGRPLPLDPAALRLDLPILVAGSGEEGDSAAEEVPPSALGVLADEAVRIQELDPDLAARVSELHHEGPAGVRVRLLDPSVDLIYHPPLRPSRLQEGLVVLTDALDRREEEDPAVVDLRFADQVVVEFTPGTGR